MKTKEQENQTLQLIPKTTSYIEYMLDVIMKLPRTEKFNIGNEYKQSMYRMLEYVMYLQKIIKIRQIWYLSMEELILNWKLK